jgi:hypothetical protein
MAEPERLEDITNCQVCGRKFNLPEDDEGRPVGTIKATCGHVNLVLIDTAREIVLETPLAVDIETIRNQVVEEVFAILLANDEDLESFAIENGVDVKGLAVDLLAVFAEMVKETGDQIEMDATIMTERLKARLGVNNPKLAGVASRLAIYGTRIAPTALAFARYAGGI